MKKFRAKIALILVLSLTLAVAIPALAAQTTKITGKYEAPAIEVVIPTTATAVINPFGLPVEVFAEDGKSSLGYVGAGASVATRPLVGYNASLFDLNVSASVVGTPKGEITLNGTTGTTTKASVINFDFKANDFDYTTVTDTWYYDASTAKQNKTTVIGQLDGAFVLGALNAWTTDTANAVQVTETAATTNAISIKKGTEVENAAGKKSIEPAADGVFFARLSGEVAEEPFAVDSKGNVSTTEKAAWSTKDGVDVTIAWTIKLDTSNP